MLGWVMGLSMRKGITVQVSEGDRLRLEALVADPAAAGNGARADGCADADRSAGRGDPLDGPNDGQTGRDQCQLGAADLAHPWATAASRASVQAVARPPIRHQAA